MQQRWILTGQAVVHLLPVRRGRDPGYPNNCLCAFILIHPYYCYIYYCLLLVVLLLCIQLLLLLALKSRLPRSPRPAEEGGHQKNELPEKQDYTPEVTKVSFHLKMPPKVDWTIPAKVRWKSGKPL